MNRVFIGYDERQILSFTALQQSIISLATQPVAITALRISQLPIKRTGLTPFTYSRFLVPHLCDYQGWGLFLDADIILNDDITKLFALADESKAVMVSKSEHRFEWASVMLFNCAHPANKILTPAFIETGKDLHAISWCAPELVGDLPREWNHLVGYDTPRDDPKLIHYTQGIPAFPETASSEHANRWRLRAAEAGYVIPWENIMGTSVHCVTVNGKKLPKYLFDLEKQRPKPEYEETVKKLLGG